MITCVFLQKQQPVKSVNGYYQLTGVVSHLGGLASSGHYVSDILNASGNWFCCNDSQVSMSNEATVLRTRARSAYLLFYMFRTGEQQAPAHRA
ncbi:ubiquitin carboxyl-terminal hydrolase 37 [Coregonus clupeaformis]|uniref:ubiquitin carboxyl-terminal hydrolase 37 n=1 Tax=Coregonus clupeaformis TaxID=59861 RepID=UPI001E1C36BB|nr:ubiquitin carboxyl-terminal hydrolase 37 [Coregonus clupeaformis]